MQIMRSNLAEQRETIHFVQYAHISLKKVMFKATRKLIAQTKDIDIHTNRG